MPLTRRCGFSLHPDVGNAKRIEVEDGGYADHAEALMRAHLDLSRKNIEIYAAPEGMPIAIGV
ncbi:hypothetical protein [Shinella sp. G-2]|uniref:hypothetical protein n=1 Tax=Shinella sp. G-2 TaxID=3133141 RepID=UPI003D00E486